MLCISSLPTLYLLPFWLNGDWGPSTPSSQPFPHSLFHSFKQILRHFYNTQLKVCPCCVCVCMCESHLYQYETDFLICLFLKSIFCLNCYIFHEFYLSLLYSKSGPTNIYSVFFYLSSISFSNVMDKGSIFPVNIQHKTDNDWEFWVSRLFKWCLQGRLHWEGTS